MPSNDTTVSLSPSLSLSLPLTSRPEYKLIHEQTLFWEADFKLSAL